MRKVYFLLSTLLLAIFTHAQNVTVNPGGGSYTDLASALAAVNSGTHTGAVTISIVNNTTEPAGGAILNASGSGAASYTSIVITPSGGARTIAGAATAGTPLIDLNGADNVTFDGLNSGGNSLTIENTTVSATSGTSTIRFIGGATSNTIIRCSLKGAVSSSVATNGAIVFFSTDAVTANGNDNNTISGCDIGPSGANLPTKAILGNGSTTTTAIGNSGITITNNDIHDFFGAAVTSSGVATNGGCNTWTITNNRFYQTGTRTWTTGATHRAIDINNTTATSGAQGFTITGNIVGYASNTQSGVYTLTGSTGKFQGIQFNGITGGALSTINNNNVAAVSMSGVTSSGTSTSSPMLGIMITNGLVTSNGNLIGSQSATGSLSFSTTTTTATDIYGMFNFSLDDWNTNNNEIGGITVTNAGASGTFLVFGMRANTSTAKVWNATLNTIGGTVANSIQLNGTGVSSQVVGMQTPTAISTLTRNTIRNLTSNIGTGTTTAASVAGIIFTSTTPNQTVSQNTIFNLTNTNATAASVVTGIQFTGGTGANLVERNLIYDLSVASSSATAEVNGIRVGGGTTTYRNNMIRIGTGIPNAVQVNGFNEFLGTNIIWHNSIYVSGTATAGTANSFAFNGQQTVNTRSFRNNIFYNARSNGGATGKNYAVRVGGSGVNPAGLTVNNNIYFANGTGAVFGLFNAADVANLAAWQAAVGQDANSQETNPLYISATDLHIGAGSPAIDVAANLGVTKDFDNDSRPGANALFDIGADERDGIPALLNDMQATAFIDPANGGVKLQGSAFSPQASFTNNGENNQTAVTVRYRILDPSAVEIYNQTQVIASLNSAASTTITFPGTSIATAGVYTIITRTELAGDQLTTNDEITGTLNISAPLAGTYTVGAGGNYPSLTNPAGIFEAINSLGATAPLTINIISNLTGETGAVSLNEIAGGHTVLIQPSGGPRTITGSINGPLIKINGADGITMNGSSTGATAAACLLGGDASIRELTIQNTNIGTSAWVIAVQSGTNGAQNITLKNLNLLGQDPVTTLGIISIGGATAGTTGADNDNCRVENCSMKRAIIAVYSAGTSVANQNTGTVITQNDASALATDRIRRVGIMVFNTDGAQITYNNIGGIETNEAIDAIGIALGNQAIDATITTAGGISNALVSNNKINGVASLSTTGFSAAGITIAGTNIGVNTIQNNMISGVTAPSTSPDLLAGIFIVGATGTATRVYHNSVSMTGDRGTVATQMPGFGIAITGTDPVVDMRNNIFYTTQIASGGGVNAKSYAVGMVTTTFANLTSNYNIFWSTGANDGGFRTGSLSTAAGTDYATLALYAAATGKDANSVEVLPPFVNDVNDLHVTASNNLGTPIATVTTDFDCQTRNATTPDIGADEFPQCVATGGTASGSTAFCLSGTPTITASGYSNDGTNFQWYSSTVLGDYPAGGTPVSGQTNPASLTTGVVTATTYYWLRVTCAGNLTTANSTMVTVTINPAPAQFAVTGGGTYCTGGTGVPVGLSGSETGVNYQLFVGASPAGAPVAGTGAAISFGNQTAAGTYTVVATNTTTTCTNTMTGSAVVATDPLPTQFTVTGGGAYCTGGSGVAVGLSGSETGVNYQLFVGASPAGAPVAGTGAAIDFGSQTAAGTYTVVASNTTTICTNTMTGSVAVSTNPLPTQFSVTGGGSYCAGGAGVAVGLSDSETGVNYQLQVNTINTGAPVAGTGAAISFGSQTAAGSYTVIATNATTTCINTMAGAVTISITPAPSLSSIVTEPTTCVSADGSINLTVSGAAPGPYTYNWSTVNGAGLVNGQEDQTGLTVGQYQVIVTSSNGCSAQVIINLNGPGGCSICPTVGSLTTAPASPVCDGTSITLTASGLASMGVTYGITFKYSLAPLADPYSGGTVIATVPNGSLTGGGTTAATTFTYPAAGTYYTYAILSPTPGDPGCRPSATTTMVVNPIPTVNAVSNQVVCNNANTTAVNFSGSVPGTTFNWINSDPSIGLAASGTGDIASFVATNSGTAPVTATVTVTPSTTGPTQNVTMPAQTGTFSSNVRGYWFTAPANFVITNLYVPTDASSANQSIAVLRFDGNTPPPVFSGTTNAFTTLFLTQNNPSGAGIPVNIPVSAGEVIGILGCRGATTSYSNTGNTITIAGNSVPLTRMGMQFQLATTAPQDIWQEPTSANIGRVNFDYTAQGCTGTPTSFTYTVNPTPVITPVPDQVVCNGAAIPPVNFTVSTTGGINAISWTNSNPAIGIPANGTGNVFGYTATNTTNAPISGTITVTPTYTNGSVTCTGPSITYTVTVNPTATVNAVANQTVCNGSPTAAVNFSSPTTGGTIVYNWTNNTPSIGLGASGNGDIASFNGINTGTSPVTATITVTPEYTSGSVTCNGTPQTFTITVNPTPTITAVANQTVCNGAAIPPVNFVVSTTGGINSIAWTNSNPAIGIPASGTGNIFGFTATNTTNAPISGTITVTPTFSNNSVSCTGPSITYTVTVNPTATVNAVANQTVCNGASTTAVNFSSPTTGGTIVYNWTNNTPSIGLAGSGNGNIAAFTATNTGTAPVTATITVTPAYTNGSVTCNGTPQTFTITVNPTATVNAVANQTVCNGSSTTAVTFSSPTTGGSIVYNWTNNTPGIGLAGSGNGNIAAFTATNTGTAPVVATITVTPVYTNGVSCTGTPRTFTITVNPTPNAVATPATQTICSGSPMTTIALTGAVTGTTFTWTRDNTTNVTGVPNSGTGNISGTPINNTNATQTVTYTITPSANGCPGTPITATVIINKAPTVVCPANIVVNSTVGLCTAPVTYTPTVTGAPAPTLSYATTGATVSSGSGSGSGLLFNVGVTTVTITATNSCGSASCSFTVTVNDSQLPTITAQPQNRAVCAGQNATFSVTAVTAPSANGPLAYQWQQWNGTAWVNVSGATSSSFTVSNVTQAMNTNTFRVVITGLCTTVNSGAATLTVNPLPGITLNASPTASLLPGQTTTITATVSPAGGTFAWSLNGSPISGVTGNTVGPIDVNGIGTYQAVYTSPLGCTSASASISITAMPSQNLWVYPVPNAGTFNVRFYNQTGEAATVKVYNALGQEMYQQKLTLGIAYSNIVVNLGKPPAGTYIVKVVNSNNVELAAKRVVIYN